MNNNLNFLSKLLLFSLTLLLLTPACKKEVKPPAGGGNTGQTEQQLFNQIQQRFPFTPNQPFSAIYNCRRLGSQLAWYFVFYEDQSMQVLFTTDTWDDFVFDGAYSYTNGELRLQMPAGPNMPFPQGLDERSTVIMPQFGLVAAFATPEMACVCEGHNLNPVAPPKIRANYDCPIINIQAASDEDNAIEFVHTAIPFEQPVPGSIFRQQDTYVNGLTNPIIRRSFGIYRMDGDKFYASFRIASDFVDFAGDALPNGIQIDPPFEDFNVISGEFRNNGQEIIVDQLRPEEGPCSLR